MRTAGKAKAGYYPTPLSVVELIGKHVSVPLGMFNSYSALDPSAGTGEALQTLAKILNEKSPYYSEILTAGIEISATRYAKAKANLDAAHRGDARNFIARNFSLLFLNPPYDYDHEGNRLEDVFLRRYYKALIPGGVLIYIVPEPYLELLSPLLTSHFENINVYRFPSEEYEHFKQVVVFGKRREYSVPANEEGLNIHRKPLGAFSSYEIEEYLLPASKNPLIEAVYVDPNEMLSFAKESKAWNEAWETVAAVRPADNLNPLLPIGEEHMALLIGAGHLNNVVIDTPEGPLILKGTTQKVEVELPPEGDADVSKSTTVEKYVTKIFAFNLKNYQLTEIA